MNDCIECEGIGVHVDGRAMRTCRGCGGKGVVDASPRKQEADLALRELVLSKSLDLLGLQYA